MPQRPVLRATQGPDADDLPAGNSSSPAGKQPAPSARDKYRALCRHDTSIQLFARDWWLDATAGADGWDVAIVEKGGKIVAALPYQYRNKMGFRLVGQPALTPALGPWFASHDGGLPWSMSQQRDMLTALIADLPRFHYFAQNWHSRNTNWLPFYWKGFQQTTRYTYVLKDIRDPEKLRAQFQHQARTAINKATQKHHLQVRDDLPLEALFSLNHKTFDRQDKQIPYTNDYVRRLDAACLAHDCRKLLVAVDQEGNYHAAVYMVWDENSAYYLIGGGDPRLRTSGAASLCLWEAIRHASGVTQQFDFEGSMMEPVEQFFRLFGGEQVPYFHLRKTPSRLLRARESLLSVLGKS